MKLENQVCTLAQAQRLKELGVNAKSIFCWEQDEDTREWGVTEVLFRYTFISAFTCAELGVMLSNVRYKSFGFPLMFTSYSYNYDEMHRIFGKWSCSFRNPRDFDNPDIKTETEAEARAAMLIHLLESNLITAEEINKKL